MSEESDLEKWLPVGRKEMEMRGWDAPDVILVSGDAYVDHPSFGTAVIGRILEAEGVHVVVLPQPNWQDDLRDFKKLGVPRLFFAVTGGCMDSMVNHYTAAKRRRSDDAYTAGGKAGFRPDYATTVYSRILKKLYPEVPLIIGGIEASLRRVTHYDYWSDTLMPSILTDSGADILFYGMGEKSLVEFVRLLQRGVEIHKLTTIPQTAFLRKKEQPYATNPRWEELVLASHEECLGDKKIYALNFKHIEEESNKLAARRLIQHTGDHQVVINPPWPPLTEKEMDRIYDLPFTRMPHPRYHGKGPIPAYEMIRHSVNIHRGCFGGCAFCTISAHQGKFVSSRSPASVLREVETVTRMEDFKGYISDIGGPSANMYRMQGFNPDLCAKCTRPSCIWPAICKNLDTNHQPLTDLYRQVRNYPGVKKAFIGSGIRYDLFLHITGKEKTDKANREYLRELIRHHVSGRLKVAPEHTSAEVLRLMRKPSFDLFLELNRQFLQINRDENLNQQLIPYFISSHPGCRPEEMADLAVITKQLEFRLEQVQDFTPTPMTLATEIYYSGYHPYTLEKVYSARTLEQRQKQRQFFFWYKKEFRIAITAELKNLGRDDLINKLFREKRSRR
ncbi:MAG TPA: YgiQ family radical SAM protein [Prolixibacteraceae bacterium]|nr:YgiQ family radical SAM protein [Prolixibacteraceae bacterium]HOR99950.1 YgiQ family radical SAM protein [Prolixibacteraceae bacterium]HOS90455.1 YgiQ family radical SAM protein [Prolixibacteraceae bacterium]HPL45131.1 YgiQ family radical SAM protein [Prolixibacteraceae bacterium]HQE52537.1 YgiQ family radical SAM protein [Prolixibacteraceae bacterium]